MQYQPLKLNIEVAQPLVGRNILVTRAAHQAAQLAQALTRAGANVIEMPLIEILPPPSWAQFDAAFNNIEKYNQLLFAGVNAVEFTVARLKQIEKLAAARSQLAVAAVGSATAQSARAHGFNVVFHPSEFKISALAQQLASGNNHGSSTAGSGITNDSDFSSIKMIWPRTDIGLAHAADELRKLGAQVDTVVCYRTALPENKNEVAEKLAALLMSGSVGVITLNSAQTVRNFYSLLKLGLDSRYVSSTQGGGTAAAAVDLQSLLAPLIIAVIGPETAAAAKQLLGKADIEATTHTVAGLVEELMCCLGTQPPARI